MSEDDKSEHWTTTWNRGVVKDYRQRGAESITVDGKAYWDGIANRAEREAAETARKKGDKL